MYKVKFVIITFFVALLLFRTVPAFSEVKVGEGYATPSFKELYQTMIISGGLDINDSNVLDEYIRLAYCDVYLENFSNDYEWNKVRKRIFSRLTDKKETSRVLYEITEVFVLDHYDFEKEYFPIKRNSAMSNVGSLTLFDIKSFESYCNIKKPAKMLPADINLVLHRPLNVSQLKVPSNYVEEMLARMEEESLSHAGDKGYSAKRVYARIRFRVTDAPGLFYRGSSIVRSELRGIITAIDFFYDSEMTKKISNIEIIK